jgi:hypothetical protein
MFCALCNGLRPFGLNVGRANSIHYAQPLSWCGGLLKQGLAVRIWERTIAKARVLTLSSYQTISNFVSRAVLLARL